jgi:hypothetical protein
MNEERNESPNQQNVCMLIVAFFSGVILPNKKALFLLGVLMSLLNRSRVTSCEKLVGYNSS